MATKIKAIIAGIFSAGVVFGMGWGVVFLRDSSWRRNYYDAPYRFHEYYIYDLMFNTDQISEDDDTIALVNWSLWGVVAGMLLLACCCMCCCFCCRKCCCNRMCFAEQDAPNYKEFCTDVGCWRILALCCCRRLKTEAGRKFTQYMAFTLAILQLIQLATGLFITLRCIVFHRESAREH